MRERRKEIHAQVLTNINDTNITNISNGASNIIMRVVDDVTTLPTAGSIDYRMMTTPHGSLYLYAETEPHYINKINCYFIFLNSISDVDNTTIKLQDNGMLSVPNFSGLHVKPMETNPKHTLILVVGNSNFTAEDIEKAKVYTEKNGLIYAGECILTDNTNLYNTMTQLAQTVELESKKRIDSAYAKGAASGAFKDILPPELGEAIGRYVLFPRDAAFLSFTRMEAANRAQVRAEEEVEKQRSTRPRTK